MPPDLILPERLDNSDASGLHETLLSRRFHAIHIDGKALQSIGVLVAQVLFVAATQWRADGQPFHLTASDALRHDMANLGLLFPELSQECPS
ncbi:MAG: STAS domain-containing protein [Rhodobacteraceae bacterium]|nr:STAS domain-containing protein [Paracoccaceae bacterium]